jgi:hypothetical protein
VKSYKHMTLQDLIDALKALPEGSKVKGLDNSVHSYQGFYEQNAIPPTRDVVLNAHELAQDLVKEIGSTLYGWKGGEFPCDPAQPVYLADTGPAIVGLERADWDIEDLYEPVVVESGRWY